MMTFLILRRVVTSLLLVGLVMVAVANGGRCTRETCPPGPVWAQFRTPNCSDTPEYYPLSETNTTIPFNACGLMALSHLGPLYMSINSTDDGVYVYYGFSNTCSKDKGVTFGEDFVPYDVCPPGTSSDTKIPLSNVNATYIRQNMTVDLSYPNLEEIRNTLACAGPDDCARPDSTVDFWTTRSNSSCGTIFSTAEYNVSYDGTCYRWRDYDYVTYECIDETTTLTKRYMGEGCQTLYQAQLYQESCNGLITATFKCTAAPLSVPLQATPSSTTSTVLPPLLLILVCIIATFI